jgi:DNA-binding transcriptional MerR regulator
MDDPDALLPVESAGSVAGISPRTLRYWIKGGKLPATEGQRGKLVRLGDVLALAELTGKRPAAERQAAGNPATASDPARSAGNHVGNAGSDPTGEASALAVSEAARAQLEAIRDEWLRPFAERSEALARELGRVEAERDHLARERDDLALQLQAAREAATARQEAPGTTERVGSGPAAAAPWWRRMWRVVGGG